MEKLIFIIISVFAVMSIATTTLYFAIKTLGLFYSNIRKSLLYLSISKIKYDKNLSIEQKYNIIFDKYYVQLEELGIKYDTDDSILKEERIKNYVDYVYKQIKSMK